MGGGCHQPTWAGGGNRFGLGLRFARRLDIVVEAARLDRRRLLLWIVAWTGLSAAWFLGDSDPLAEIDLAIARLAAAELDWIA
ncbi:aminoglycoside phosphotransferase family protein [Bradyrhizobium septentrionale]|uniref:aminoglycoside phosphotransferase family protein n=1 Tax=Bradyrhizobium septentrionale TaxID=1404411 RepID=UPI001CD2C484|nr:aminoglycoside phosphotransferase family protein [Bradyrhizobium septentrionale]